MPPSLFCLMPLLCAFADCTAVVRRQKNGLDMGQIAKMFLAGMVSSMITGMFGGSFLDRWGEG